VSGDCCLEKYTIETSVTDPRIQWFIGQQSRGRSNGLHECIHEQIHQISDEQQIENSSHGTTLSFVQPLLDERSVGDLFLTVSISFMPV
jgi:hypothetical protein